MKKPALAVGLIVAAFVTGSCSVFRLEANVDSNTSWSGDFNGRTVDGTGSQTVSLGSGTGPKCAVVQKQTTTGYLTVEIGSDKKTTTAAYGVVSVCGGGN